MPTVHANPLTHEDGAFQKQSSNIWYLKTPAFYFILKTKLFEDDDVTMT